MFWIIVAIIVAGIIIANAIKSSMWEANATPEQKAARYNAQTQAAQMQNARKLCLAIHELCKRGKSNRQIAGNAKVQKYAIAAGIDISNEDDVREVKRNVGYLNSIGCLEKFKAMVAAGDDDEKIARKLGREYQGYLMYKCYDAEDIRFMRSSILGHGAHPSTNKQLSWSEFNDVIDQQ